LEYAIQENQKEMELNGTYQLLAYVDDNDIVRGNRYHTEKHSSNRASKEFGLDVNPEEAKYM
jgi:hypothetical protein